MTVVALNVGDVVELKSGGPHMTVATVTCDQGGEATSFTCTWFSAARDAFEYDEFEPGVLKVIGSGQ